MGKRRRRKTIGYADSALTTKGGVREGQSRRDKAQATKGKWLVAVLGIGRAAYMFITKEIGVG